MVRITVKKGRNEWVILKNGRRVDAETSKRKAEHAARFYRQYFKVPPKLRSYWSAKVYRGRR